MKIRVSVLLILLVAPCFSFSQTTLPNMDFEQWTSKGGGAYLEPSGGTDSVWTTDDKIVLLGFPMTTVQTTDAYSGTYAAE